MNCFSSGTLGFIITPNDPTDNYDWQLFDISGRNDDDVFTDPSLFGDGLNDYLQPNNVIKADNLLFRVYNRLGQLVFETRDWTRKWDGRINGVLQQTGVYTWLLTYTHHDTGEKVFMKGTTLLIR